MIFIILIQLLITGFITQTKVISIIEINNESNSVDFLYEKKV